MGTNHIKASAFPAGVFLLTFRKIYAIIYRKQEQTMKVYLYLLFFMVADTAVWFGICFIVLWIVVHGFLLWTGVEFVKWVGID